jgi:hypothetical protein
LIITDLIELASNRAICDAVLVTGDSDLAVGIELAQKRGVRIAVIGLEDLSVGVSHKQSFEITSRADCVSRLGGADLSPVMHYDPASTSSVSASQPAPVPTAQPTPKRTNAALTSPDRQAIEQSVKGFIAQQASLSGAVDPSTKRIDSTVDRVLIHHVYTDLGRGALTQNEKIYARDTLKKELGV